MRKLIIFLLFVVLASGVFLISNRFNFKGGDIKSYEVEKVSNLLKPLANPPLVIQGIYATAWSAGSSKKIEELISFIKTNDLNAIVIDIKDYSGFLSYDSDVPEVNKYRAEEIKIGDLDGLIKRLHSEGIYIIARQTVFQDPVLAKARPELALKSKKTGKPWVDHKKLSWVDMAARETWDYNISIAKEAFQRGFDEVNFDYIRFVSDGNLDDIEYPFWDETTPKRAVLREFFSYLRQELGGHRISADLFGLTTIASGDLGIGQVIEDFFPYFDYVDPMIYPSHYSAGFEGFENPAKEPFEVVRRSMDSALARLYLYITNPTSTFSQAIVADVYKLRPWLQDFDIGAIYDKVMVEDETQGVSEAYRLIKETVSSTIRATSTRINLEKLPEYSGWLMWAPDNRYTSINSP